MCGAAVCIHAWQGRATKDLRRGRGGGRGCVDSKNSHTTPATSTTPMRQLLGAADAKTAHLATSSTAPAHQPLGSASAETTPARAPAAAAKGRTGDCPGPRKETTPRQNVTQGGGGVVRAPGRRGVGFGNRKGALVTGQSKEARLKTLMMTHHLRCKAARKIFFPKKFSP